MNRLSALHWADLDKLVKILHALADQGNTILMIEHNLDLIKIADHIIDLGPEARAWRRSNSRSGYTETNHEM